MKPSNTVALLHPVKDVIKPHRLFMVRNKRTNELSGVDGSLFFTEKMEAKARRNALNSPLDKPVWYVTAGPDHRRYRHD